MKKRNVLRAICIGTLSLASVTGCKNTTESSEESNKETTKEEQKEEKTETVEQEVVEASLDDIIKNPENYENVMVKVKGVLPNDSVYSDSEGVMKTQLYTEDMMNSIEITGILPDEFYCIVFVTGIIHTVQNGIEIEASAYEVVEPYGDSNYNPADNYGATVYGPPSVD